MRSVDPELIVTEDVPETALGVFLEVAPRTVLLSGGSTPQALYERMAELEDYSWARVEFFFGDERCVPAGHELSNMRMAAESLLSKVDADIFAMNGADCDAESYERLLRDRFPHGPSFDLAVYGLGADGHSASLFPGRPEVEVEDRWVVHVPQAGMAPFVPRISLTVPALSASPVGMFLVEGEDKREALRRLLAAEDIPAARISPGRLLVVADADAARRER